MVFQNLVAHVRVSFSCRLLNSSRPLASLAPSCGPCSPDCFLFIPQRQGTGTYLNMSWSKFFQKTGIR